MCGLAGIAVNAASVAGVGRAVWGPLFEALLRENERRGSHATGVATFLTAQKTVGEKDIWKMAERATTVLNSEAWSGVVRPNLLRSMTAAVIGHTRHATHNNARLDKAAHPFVEGNVIGAHNGVIDNWMEIERGLAKGTNWIVDSQAAFGLLAHHDDPAEALGELEGYFALTWWKEGMLHIARSSGAMLSCAYAPKQRLMAWASEKSVLTRTLDRMNIGAYEVWEPSAGCIYTYAPERFGKKGTNGVKTTFKEKTRFRSRHVPAGVGLSQGYSTVSSIPPYRGRSIGDPYDDGDNGLRNMATGATTGGTRRKPKLLPPPKGGNKLTRKYEVAQHLTSDQLGLAGHMADNLLSTRAVAVQVSRLQMLVMSLRERVDTLELENDHLYSLLEDLDPRFKLERPRHRVEVEVEDNTGDADDGQLPLLDEVAIDTEDVDDTPYKFEVRPRPVCETCGRPGSPQEPLLQGRDGAYIHDDCIFAGSC